MDVDVGADAPPKLEGTKLGDTKLEDTKGLDIETAGSGTISPVALDVKDEVAFPDDPNGRRAVLQKMIANAVNDCLRELGYFPGQLEMFKRLQSENKDFFEESARLQSLVDQQQRRIAGLEYQMQLGAAELNRTTGDLHVMLRRNDELIKMHDQLVIDYRTVCQRLPPHERPTQEFPRLTLPAHPTYSQMGPGPQAMIPAAMTPGMDYIPRISHVQPGMPMQAFVPPGAVPMIPMASTPVVPQVRPRPKSRSSLGSMPPPSTIPSQSQSSSQPMPPPPPPVAGPSQPRSLGTIRIPARRATMPASVIDLTANDSETDDQEGARKRPRVDDAQSASVVPQMSPLDMQAVEDEFKRSVAGISAAPEPGPPGESVSAAMPAKEEEPIDVDEGDEDEDMSDRLDENGLLKPEYCVREAYEERDGKMLCKMCRFRSTNLAEDEHSIESNDPDELAKHLEIVHPQGWKKLRGIE